LSLIQRIVSCGFTFLGQFESATAANVASSSILVYTAAATSTTTTTTASGQSDGSWA